MLINERNINPKLLDSSYKVEDSYAKDEINDLIALEHLNLN